MDDKVEGTEAASDVVAKRAADEGERRETTGRRDEWRKPRQFLSKARAMSSSTWMMCDS